MGNFLTDGRLGLIAALKADPAIADRVRTWFDFGPGLRRRHSLEPALCPALSVAPAQGAELPVGNVEVEIPQTLRVEVATDGQDASPCEELVALVLSRVRASNETCLGLAADGLTGLRVRSILWSAAPDQASAHISWTAAIEVQLLWRRL
jgi:hypothetical protein